MRCPICKKHLTRLKERYFETLVEHVGYPNKDNISPRITWECINLHCEAFDTFFWNTHGELYSICCKNPNKKDFVDELTDALDSPSRTISLKLNK